MHKNITVGDSSTTIWVSLKRPWAINLKLHNE